MRRFNVMRTWSLRAVALFLVCLLALLLPSAVLAQPDGPPSPLDPASVASREMANLHNIVLIIAVAVFLIVEGALVVFAFAYRGRPKDGSEPPQIHGNNRLELAWTVAPALLVVALFVMTIRTQRTIDAADVSIGGLPPLRVQVIGHQWWWEFIYPDYRFSTAGEMVVPARRVIELEITSPKNGVIHSFWVPQLNGKTDAVPGLINRMPIQANEVGDYYGQCAELCGLSHAYMRFVVSAVSEDDFAEWVKNQAQEAVAPATPEAQEGQQVFLSAGCVGCHTVRGEASAQGKTGPELTHVATRPFIAGGMLTFTEHNLSRWLADPPGIKPASIMPNLNLTPGQISSLVAYLTSLQ